MGVSKDGIINEFDAIAPQYETNRLSHWYTAHSQILLQCVQDAPPAALLDIGCGTGWLLRQAAGQWPSCRLVGLDISPGMITVARRLADKHRLPQIEWRVADWEIESARQEDRSFDTVTCASCFHYFERPSAALEKIRRATAPGGHVYLVERDKSGSLFTHAWDGLHRAVIRDHVRFYTTRQLLDLLHRAGFVDIRVLRSLRKLFWNHKLYTSTVVIRGTCPA